MLTICVLMVFSSSAWSSAYISKYTLETPSFSTRNGLICVAYFSLNGTMLLVTAFPMIDVIETLPLMPPNSNSDGDIPKSCAMINVSFFSQSKNSVAFVTLGRCVISLSNACDKRITLSDEDSFKSLPTLAASFFTFSKRLPAAVMFSFISADVDISLYSSDMKPDFGLITMRPGPSYLTS